MKKLQKGQTVYFMSGGYGPKRVCSGVVSGTVEGQKNMLLVNSPDYEEKPNFYHIPVNCLYVCAEELKLMYALNGRIV